MKFKLFNIPVSDPSSAEIELNAFIAQHRIAPVDRQFVVDGANSFWAFCITWLESESP